MGEESWQVCDSHGSRYHGMPGACPACRHELAMEELAAKQIEEEKARVAAQVQEEKARVAAEEQERRRSTATPNGTTSSNGPTLDWDLIDDRDEMNIWRTKIPGGWLVHADRGNESIVSLTFVPDPKHEWNGRSL
jgi:hypothetical protein